MLFAPSRLSVISDQSFEYAITCRGTTRLNLPCVILRNVVQRQTIRDFFGFHGCIHELARLSAENGQLFLESHTSLYILLVREHQQQRILHFTILDDTSQFRLCLIDTLTI